MLRKYGLPLLAVGMLAFAVIQVVNGQQTGPKVEPPIAPPRTPFTDTLAGAGLIEAQTENISVGSALPGVVTAVLVKVGQAVKAGDVLFQLDDRPLVADVKVRQANLAAAQAKLARLEAMPRPEERPLKEARVRELQANLTDQQDQLNRAEQLFAGRAIGEEEVVRRRQAHRMAKEQLALAKADLELLLAGAWTPDKVQAQAEVAQVQAQLEQTQVDLDRLKVRALVDGEVLQVNVRPGEFVGAPPGQALVVLGNLDRLHVRVDVDEHDIPRFRPGQPARAVIRGLPGKPLPLTFVRVEPYVVPKKALTGDNKERVDTRVLQVIYALEPGSQRVYVGQQMDVFIDTAAAPAVATAGEGK
jgi:multidrug resistance efflux pump